LPATPSASAPPRLVLALVAAAYVLPLLVPVPLMEDDEGLHAAIAIEMVERGDWVVPRLMGQPFRDKPILYFWMQAASIRAFGASEFAVRLPGTLMALAGIAATGWLGRLLAGVLVGRWAALCYATMLLPFAISLAPLHDLVMVPLVALAFAAFWQVHRATSPSRVAGWSVAAAVVLGLSILGKGLTGVGLVGVGMVAWMLWTRTWSARLIGAAAVALALGAVLAWPWYAAMERASPGYLDYFFLQRHVEGVAGETQRHAGRADWYYLPILVAGTWPWGLDAVRRGLRQTDLVDRLLWAWLVADMLLLSAAGSKLATYLLPTFPVVAILAARAIVLLDDRPVMSRLRLAVLAATAALPVVAEVYLERTQPTVPAGWTGMIAALAPLALLAWSLEGGRRSNWNGPVRLLAVTAMTLVAAGLTIRPMVAVQLSARGLSAHVNREAALPPRLYIVDEGVGSFLFYLRPELRRGLTPDRVQRVSRFSLADAADPGGAMVAIANDRVDGVRELYDLPLRGSGMVGGFQVLPLTELRPKGR
jgi:4-amino-4-deoxy-L-arabinose transferase-like glycosyltransferase